MYSGISISKLYVICIPSGDYSVTVRASNDKSSEVTKAVAGVDIPISNVTYSIEHAEVGGEVQHSITVTDGSRITLFWTHGDGTVEEK